MNEFEKKLKLINRVMRYERNLEDTMQFEFPLLINEKNMENMLCIYENEMPISALNILYAKLSVNNEIFNTAFIGGVCTYENHRRKGHSTNLIEKALKKMNENNVDLVFVSSFKNHYKKHNFFEVNSDYKYEIQTQNKKNSQKFTSDEFFKNSALKTEFINIYNTDKIRFLYKDDEIITLLKARLFPKQNKEYEIHKLQSGFIILEIDKTTNNALVVDIIGVKENLIESIKNLNTNAKKVDLYLNINSNLNSDLDEKTISTNKSMIKILNKDKIIKYLENKNVIKINYTENTFKITKNSKTYTYNISEFTRALFQNDTEFKTSLNIEIPNLQGLSYQ